MGFKALAPPYLVSVPSKDIISGLTEELLIYVCRYIDYWFSRILFLEDGWFLKKNILNNSNEKFAYNILDWPKLY